MGMVTYLTLQTLRPEFMDRFANEQPPINIVASIAGATAAGDENLSSAGV